MNRFARTISFETRSPLSTRRSLLGFIFLLRKRGLIVLQNFLLTKYHKYSNLRNIIFIVFPRKFTWIFFNFALIMIALLNFLFKNFIFILFQWCMLRSSHQRCSMKKSLFRNFAKFTGKHLRQSQQLIKKETLAQVFLVNFTKFLRTSSLQNTSGRLLLHFYSKSWWINFENMNN